MVPALNSMLAASTQAVLLNFRVQLFARDAQQFGGLNLVALGIFERTPNQVPLHISEAR